MTTMPAGPAPAVDAGPSLTSTAPEKTPSAYQRALAAARKLSAAALAPSTRRGYRADWQAFTEWCSGLEERPSTLPARPETVAAFLGREAFERRRAFATVKRRADGIARAHARAGLPSPTRAALVVDTLRGIRNELALPPRKKR